MNMVVTSVPAGRLDKRPRVTQGTSLCPLLCYLGFPTLTVQGATASSSIINANIMKTYLTLLFCAPMVLFVLGAIVMNADTEDGAVSNTVTTAQTAPTRETENNSAPLLVKAGSRGWAGTAMHSSDSTHITALGHFPQQQ
jgi:hypothetical protein